MENPRAEKVAVVTEVRERLTQADAALLTEYRGLDVKAMAELRRALRAAGGDYKIYKNTLVRLGARDAGIDVLDELLTGPTAIAFVDGDAAAVAKALRDYAKTQPEPRREGRPARTARCSAPARSPRSPTCRRREAVLAQLAGALQAPIAQFASLLAALPRNFAYGLKALIDQQGGVPEVEAPVAEAPAAEAPADEAPAAEAPAPRHRPPRHRRRRARGTGRRARGRGTRCRGRRIRTPTEPPATPEEE